MRFPTVRLGKEAFGSNGLVEVYHNKTWGWICDQQWDKQDADVVCRELGYTDALSIYSRSAKEGGMVWMNNVHCVGNERSLFSCIHDVWKNHNCINDKLAGVVCSTPEGNQRETLHLYILNLFCHNKLLRWIASCIGIVRLSWDSQTYSIILQSTLWNYKINLLFSNNCLP